MPQKEPGSRREYMRAYKERNRERLREQQRQNRERNRDKRKEYERRYYEENRERILKRTSERYWGSEAVRRAKAEAARQWRIENPEKNRMRARRVWAKRKYGLTLEEAEAILARGCAICGAKEDPQRGDRRHGRLCIDHDHANGKVRAALCHGCNTGLGSFGDDPKRLRAAARYLEGHLKTGS